MAWNTVEFTVYSIYAYIVTVTELTAAKKETGTDAHEERVNNYN